MSDQTLRAKIEQLHRYTSLKQSGGWIADPEGVMVERAAVLALVDADGWQPISTAPKDGTRVDLWAKCWRPSDDGFSEMRCPNCYWTKGDSEMNRRAAWVNLETGWYPTHWRPLQAPPEGV